MMFTLENKPTLKFKNQLFLFLDLALRAESIAPGEGIDSKSILIDLQNSKTAF